MRKKKRQQNCRWAKVSILIIKWISDIHEFSTTTMDSEQQEAFFTVHCTNFSLSSPCSLFQIYSVLLHTTYKVDHIPSMGSLFLKYVRQIKQAVRGKTERKETPHKYGHCSCIYICLPNNKFCSPPSLLILGEKKPSMAKSDWDKKSTLTLIFYFLFPALGKLYEIISLLPLLCTDLNENPCLGRLHFINNGGKESGPLKAKAH